MRLRAFLCLSIIILLVILANFMQANSSLSGWSYRKQIDIYQWLTFDVTYDETDWVGLKQSDGVCSDGTYVYTSGHESTDYYLQKWDVNGTKIWEVDPRNGNSSLYHVGDCCYFDGKVYVTVSDFPYTGISNRRITVWYANGTVADDWPIEDNPPDGNELSTLTCDGTYLWLATYELPGSWGDAGFTRIFKYSLSGTYQGETHNFTNLEQCQGVSYHSDGYFVIRASRLDLDTTNESKYYRRNTHIYNFSDWSKISELSLNENQGCHIEGDKFYNCRNHGLDSPSWPTNLTEATVIYDWKPSTSDRIFQVLVCSGSGTDSYDAIFLNSVCTDFPNDITFTESDGETEIDHWRDPDRSNSTSAWFNIKVPTITNGEANVYLYYGKSGQASSSSMSSTFKISDDFEDTDFSNWDSMGESTAVSRTSDGDRGYVMKVDRGTTLGKNGWRFITDDTTSKCYMFEIWCKVTDTGYNVACGPCWAIDNSSVHSYYFGWEGTASHLTDKVYRIYDAAGYTEIGTETISESKNTWYLYKLVVTEHNYYHLCWNASMNFVEGAQGYSGSDETYDMDDKYIGARVWRRAAYWDNILYWECPLASAGDIGSAEVPNQAPTNDACAITDMDDTDNIYAQKKYYTLSYNVTDPDGYSDIDYCEARLKQSTATRAIFRYDEDTDTFSVESGSSEWSLDLGSSTATESGNTIFVWFKFSPQWDATEEADLEIECYVIDASSSADTDTMQTDYADVITTIIVTGFACDDDRGNTGQSISFSGALYYVDDSGSGSASGFSPPDSEITAVHIYDSSDVDEGSGSTTSGAFSISISAKSTPGTEVYNSYVDGADSDFTDFEDSGTDSFTADNLQVFNLQNVNYLGSAQFEYEAQIKYGSDSSVVDGATLNVSLPSGSIIGQLTSNSSGWVTFVLSQSNSTEAGNYTVFGVNDNNYGVTVTGANETITLRSWTLATKDTDGNVLSSTTLTVEAGASTVYSSGADTLRITEDTFNITVVWQSLTVNTTTNLAISADTTTDFSCLAYPYTYESVRYWTASNATISSVTWSNNLLVVKFSGAVSTYVLKASCTTKPVYTLNATFNMATDWTSILSLTHYANTTIKIQYANWGGFYLYQSDYRMTSVSWTGQVLTIVTTGTSGDTGTLKAYCGARGSPDQTTGFTTTTYSTSTLIFTGTYSFSSDKTLTMTWQAQSTTGGVGITVTPFDVFASLFAPSIIRAGTWTNGTIVIEWQGSNVIYITEIIFDEPEWVKVTEYLPTKFKRDPGESAKAMLYLNITIPDSTPPGEYEIPCTIQVRSEGSVDSSISAKMKFEVTGANYGIPEYMTFVMLGFVAVFVVGMALRRKKR